MVNLFYELHIQIWIRNGKARNPDDVIQELIELLWKDHKDRKFKVSLSRARNSTLQSSSDAYPA